MTGSDFSRNCMVTKPGVPLVLGANLMNNVFEIVPEREAVGANFAVYAPEASYVSLSFFSGDTETVFSMYDSNLGVWHIFVEGAVCGQNYGFRVHGSWNYDISPRFNEKKVLLDPYAREVSGELTWDKAVFDYQIINDHWEKSKLDSAKFVPKSILRDTYFDWEGVKKPNIPIADSIIYELHIKGFTYQNIEIPENMRGTYLGVSHPLVIDYLKNLGVTSIELMPVTSFISEERLVKMGLKNYWGYNPLCLMAPEPSYAIKDPVTEMKVMVRELHRAGIEVILDVVFNHTCESGHGGPTLSLRGLSESEYYLMEKDHGHLFAINMTGCGNTLNFDCIQTLKLTMDALRVWATEYQVDGFRFDLASVMARRHRQFHSDSAFFQAIYQDPVLSQCKVIAEPWDLGPGGYRLSGFPGIWQEWNDRFRDDAKAYWRGDNGHLAAIGWRMAGSEDIFGANRPYGSINYICSHDGFTLRDLVSYEHSHNLENGENNRDGHEHNYSCNFGVEGEVDDAVVNAKRMQIRKNLLATVLLSQGVPMLMAGDEFGNSQKGNNNAYCQDNEVSWLHWEWKKQQESEDFLLHKFAQGVIKLRQKYVMTQGRKKGRVEYHWISPSGKVMSNAELGYLDGGCLGITWTSFGKNNRLYILINNGDSAERFCLNDMGITDGIWRCLLDTSKQDSFILDDLTSMKEYFVAASSLVFIEVKNK